MAVEFGKWQKIEREDSKKNPPAVYLKGWWTNLKDEPIKRAFFGETVRFHISANNNLLNEKEIFIQFYDDDGFNDTKIGNIKKVLIKDNKAYIDFHLNKSWEDLVSNWKETGCDIELYAEVSYLPLGIKEDLPSKENEFLKVYRKHKVVMVFYHGGPFGSGQIKEKSSNDTGYTGKIYDIISSYVLSKGYEVVGAIIAPAAIDNIGIRTGYYFLKNNYKYGDQILIYAYSYGGDNAVNLAEQYRDPINTMIIVDSTDGILHQTTVDTSVPSNVEYTLNIYQTKASGGFSWKGKDSDDPNKSEDSSSDGSSNTIASRGYPHTAEGSNKVINIDATSPDTTHGNIQQKKSDLIINTFKERIDAYKYPK